MSDKFRQSEPASRASENSTDYRNPQPKQAHRVTMTIKDAPGAFRWMRPIAHYDVTDRECLSPPKENPVGRSAPTPTAPIEFVLEQSSEYVYSGLVYADAMLDKDYTGNGACHWELTSIVVQIKANGDERETLFTPGISNDELAPGHSTTVYFNKASYPRLASSQLDEPLDTGESDRARFAPSIKDSDLFTVTFKVTEEGAR